MEYNRALIVGISGQDGTLLAKFLLSKGYKVYGTSRNADANVFNNLKLLNIFDSVEIITMDLKDFKSVLTVVKDINPTEIYNLAGQTSVWKSFKEPVETIESIITGTINILEAVRFLGTNIRIFNPCSTECYGNNIGINDINSTFNPLSPYAVAKASSYWLIDTYRKSYNMFACSGILSNHESILRDDRFVTMKILIGIKRILNGDNIKLELGNTDIIRDWGNAEDYVEAMYLMLQQPEPKDYIIATGNSISLNEFIEYAFSSVKLNSKNYITISDKFKRVNDVVSTMVNIDYTKATLGWNPKSNVYDTIDNLLNKLIV